MKVLTVFGTRPELIKLIPLIKTLEADSDIENYVCNTGQHKELVDNLIELFNIDVDFDFKIMRENQSLYDLTSKLILKFKELFFTQDFDYVLVHGDTTSAFCAALSSFYSKIPVCHVEAGLRTNNILSPFPEEVNRNIISKLASLNFSPTESSKKNLLLESIPDNKIFVTGNTVVDSLILTREKINSDFNIISEIKNEITKEKISASVINKWENKTRVPVLITCHRRENFNNGIENILDAIIVLAKTYKELDFVFPIHPNPNIRRKVKEFKNINLIENIYIINPLTYFSFVYMMNLSLTIITDSGGIQEEAPTFNIKPIVARNHTERIESLENNIIYLVGSDKQKILDAFKQEYFKNKQELVNPYGDGKSSIKILKIIKANYEESKF